MVGFKFIGFFIFVLFCMDQVASECTADKLQKIEACYNSTILKEYNITDADDLREAFQKVFSMKESIHFACGVKNSLDICLSNTPASECFSVQNFMNLSFIHNSEIDARIFVANYLQLDYACSGIIPDLAYDNYECIVSAATYCQNNIVNENVLSCGLALPWIECAVNNATGTCGKPAGCFVKKFMSLDICTYDGVSDDCGICNKLSATPNPVDSLCTDDVTNIPVNGSSSKIRTFNFSLILATIFATLVFSMV